MTDAGDLRELSRAKADGAANSAGALLRAAREARGLSIDDLAVLLKVSAHKLESMESDQWAELHDPTFARALAQSACRLLKTDPAPVLALMPQRLDGGLARVTRGIDEPFRGGATLMPHAGDVLLGGGMGGKPLAIVVALLLAALAVWRIPSSAWESMVSRWRAAAPANGVHTSVHPAAQQTQAEPLALSTPQAQPTQAPVETTAPHPAPPAVAAAASAATPSVSPQAVDTLVLQANKPSWFKVVDAQGTQLIGRVLAAGESVHLDGAAPLQLTAGNAAGSTVFFRGHEVPLAASAVGNITRIELQ